ncbi:MAG: hypothetical protein A2086_03720 [Spirochaetes bacterium GWD1_27_9]|nr:MAG: hypothetical protein A2Z98_17285 [Spirochaetes bacterium GWB1_27_13]OHD20842.1 MAG: hypothetical protein A2Y34_12785 [Spirochaetes bacterium GWC1_27_15]OHD44596.1 MAG: hypothetical protein A2086_03720 [Spirochaetes bacterium GWD1_27_9]
MAQNSKFITIIAQNLSEALEKAANHFKKNKNDLNYEIIEQNDKIKIKVYLDTSKNFNKLTDDFDNAHGYFKIKYKDGFANLIVFPPKGNGIPVYPEEIINRMKILNIPKVSYEKISEIVKKASAKPEILVEWAEGANYRAVIDVKISDDKMSAFVNIQKPKKEGSELTKNDILQELELSNIKYGINEKIIDEIIEKNLFEMDIKVAEGLIPIDEKKSIIKFNFDTNPGKPFLIDEYGRINLKELNFIQNKAKEDVLAEIMPPIDGREGINLFGETIPYKKIENQNIKIGQNTVLSEDSLKIISLIDGNVYLKNNTISVEPHLTLKNVDYETGNIDFNGSITIEGTILDGFTVKATGIIQINQSVGRVIIESEKDVILKAGINGNTEGKIICKGDVYARFIEGANITCEGNIFAEEAIMNSNLKVNKNVILVGKRAEIIGGESIIGRSLRCKKLGNISGIKTKISVGIEPEKLEIIEELKDSILKYKDKMTEISNNIQKLEKTKKLNPILTEKIEMAIYKLQSQNIRIKDELMTMEKEFKESLYFLIPSKDSIVLVEQIAYPEVNISFGKEEYKINNEITKIILKIVNNKIKESGFNYNEIPQYNTD